MGFPNFNMPSFAKDGCLKLIDCFSSKLLENRRMGLMEGGTQGDLAANYAITSCPFPGAPPGNPEFFKVFRSNWLKPFLSWSVHITFTKLINLWSDDDRNLFISSQDIRTIDKFNGFEVIRSNRKKSPMRRSGLLRKRWNKKSRGYKLVFRECRKKQRWSSGSNRCLAIKFNRVRIPVATKNKIDILYHSTENAFEFL